MKIASQTFSDEEVIRKLQANDSGSDEAIRFLYRTHFEKLSRHIIVNKGSNEDAQDLFQETIISFIHLVRQGKFRKESSIGTFLFVVNKHLWMNEQKKRGRSHAREMRYEANRPANAVDLGAVLEHRETTHKLMGLVQRLGENCKKILLLFYYENCSMKEIISQLHYQNEQVARNAKYKCLKKMEQLVKTDPSLFQQLKNLLHG
jgi:RNA polymerase sigma factor (sigma-70 family)